MFALKKETLCIPLQIPDLPEKALWMHTTATIANVPVG